LGRPWRAASTELATGEHTVPGQRRAEIDRSRSQVDPKVSRATQPIDLTGQRKGKKTEKDEAEEQKDPKQKLEKREREEYLSFIKSEVIIKPLI
jgi:hypothetical protein